MAILKSAFWPSCLPILSLALAESQTADDIQRLITEQNGDSKALSAISAASWVDSPKVRGTVDILLTCVVTLVACVWSVLHQNIWTLIAILAPDTVLVVAANQMIAARGLRKELKMLQARKNKTYLVDVPLNFCFSVEMGGFQVDLDLEGISLGPSFMASCPERLPLSPAGFLKLIDMDLLNLEKMMKHANVTEKSKANVFQKLLIATQVIWMFIQCIARKSQGLPIILLEIHTVVHVVCALIVLLCWTSKPLDVNTPEIVESESDNVLGFFSLAIQSQICEQKFVLVGPRDIHSYTTAIRQDANEDDLDAERELPRILHLRPKETLPFGFKYEGGPNLHLQPTDMLRLRRATQFLRDHYGRELRHPNQALPMSQFGSFFSEGGNYAYSISGRYKGLALWEQASLLVIGPWFYTHEEEEGVLNVSYRVSIFALLVTLVYSGLHLSAWSARFPTQVEEICWKAAGIIPIGNALFALFVIYVIEFDTPSGLSFFTSKVFPAALLMFGALNGMARIYLTAESFASLRNLPIGAFSMPVWLQLFPHI
ncbi:hypothetical protein GCG54_00007537 [Colletotrichum gloeosporioides]|uniref:Uncharacterized protein n=1 Tax=Colletotrichum gloeosporioides TaxID=474922 RepID=A0A8H4CPR1_COLGL|nr:uncharacterized protein GCG54_00007537 [Colletotrichum gloeosporioides]KAF3807803.1 hypothetical protein GCG54_00007537 [Colletotrichum gloeosporioides]